MPSSLFSRVPSVFVILPAGGCGGDVVLLALFRPPAEQNDDPLAVLAKVDSVARAKVDFVLEYAAPNALRIREMSLADTLYGDDDPGGGRRIQAVEPYREGLRPRASRYSLIAGIPSNAWPL
jgi:hypothetical protein